MNALLPPAIRIVGAEEVGPDFNARWSARGKTYRYRIYRGKVVPPMIWRYVLHYPFPLDEDAMREAAGRFVGAHDFASFSASFADCVYAPGQNSLVIPRKRLDGRRNRGCAPAVAR